MAGGLTLQVRQIGSYPLVGAAGAGELLLLQPGGLGNPYASIDAQQFVKTVLNSGGSIGIDYAVPGDAAAGQAFLDAAMAYLRPTPPA